MHKTEQPVALIAGASRGLGLAMAGELMKRGWHVIGTVRGGARTALHEMAEGAAGALRIETLDVADLPQIRALRHRLDGEKLDLLLVNAGIAPRPIDAPTPEVDDDTYARIMLTNALGAARVLELLHDLTPPGGVLAAMSSVLGSLTENAAGIWPAYSSSKAALNMLLRDFAARQGGARAVAAMAPGWIRTEMGGPDAAFSIEENIPRVIDVLTGAAGKRGLHFLNYDGRTLAW